MKFLNVLNQRITVFAAIVILSTGCKKAEEGDNIVSRKISTFETLENFLVGQSNEAFDQSILEEYRDSTDSVSVEDFISFYEGRVDLEQGIFDSIAASSGIEEFEFFMHLNPEYEITRLHKITTGIGKNELLVVDGVYKWGNEVFISKYELRIDKDCVPLWKSSVTSQCFNLRSVKREVIPLSMWNELRELMIQTDFWNTTYSDNKAGIDICDGARYYLEVSWGGSILDRHHKLSKDYPGNRTAIYLLAEKLMSFIN